ncbi:probable serine/threonine-protein kinase kinX [Folsomia candida]|nr:probable serine/threonine-protein kinase kinX [Folsomia candida]
MSAPGSSRQMRLEMEEEIRQKQLEEESKRQQEDSDEVSDESESDDDDDEDDDQEEEDEESSHSDLQRNSEDSQGDLSIFNYEQDSDSSESLLDLDDNEFTSMNETKIALYEMMDTCYELDDKQGFKTNEDKILRQQVKQSATVFQKQFMPDSRLLERSKTMWQRQKRKSSIEDGESTPSTKNADSLQEDSSRRRASTKKQLSQTIDEAAKATTQAVKPSEMFLAYKHTNMCAHLLRKRTDEMGLEETLISIDDYVDGLKQMIADDEVETDSTDVAELKMYQLVLGHWKVASNLPTLVGAFDYKEYLAKEGLVVEKPKKKEVKRKTRNFDPDSLIATQVEVSITKEASAAKSKANDQVVEKFQKSLVDFMGERDSANLYEFAVNKDSMRESLNNVFGVAFGARDGTIGLTQEGKHLKITAEDSPAEDIHKMSKRRQCIVSISAASMRKLQEIAEGENAIQTSEKI